MKKIIKMICIQIKYKVQLIKKVVKRQKTLYKIVKSEKNKEKS